MNIEEQTSKLVINDPMVDTATEDGAPPPDSSSNTASASKPKRVRTGCLTCRERHLKCDEGTPDCQNCRKSQRTCKRGIRLNFIDTKVAEDPQPIRQNQEWNIGFQDESREIASEYKGGAGRYAAIQHDEMEVVKNDPPVQVSASLVNAPIMANQPLPRIQSTPPNVMSYQNAQMHDAARDIDQGHSRTGSTHSSHTLYPPSQASYATSDQTLTSQSEPRDHLSDPEETLFMQVFVEEVGLWMDSMDPHKHFSRILPFYALAEPMLLNAFLACGVRHLTLVNPAFQEDKALHYYDTATRGLLKSLQNPNRDTIICATAAVILNVYEVMSERALQRMNHIAGARALIKECGWSARSVGIGAACFWLNVGMELLSCLHFNWQVAWNPDDWGVDMTMVRDTRPGQEEGWTYKIVYITAKIANFRASIPRFQEANPAAQAMRVQDRLNQWNNLKALCDTWNECIPRTMYPMAVLLPHQTTTKSSFPEVWMIKRTSIVARLFYHTAMCLLPQIHPINPEAPEMFEMRNHHSQQICGIVAHVKDRGVATIAIRCIAIAAECLTDYKQQCEILTILAKIKKETGWRIDFLKPELKRKWGWPDGFEPDQQMQNMMQAPSMDFAYPPPQPQPSPPQQQQPQHPTSMPTTTASPPQPPHIPKGVVNPLLRMADFNAPAHPYQTYYVPPNQNHNDAHYFYGLIDRNYHGA